MRAHRGARQAHGGRHRAEVVADERDVGGLERDVGAGADRDAEVGLRQRGRVVDAVADHGDAPRRRPAAAPTLAAFSAGSTSARMRSGPMPTCAPIASAVARRSPVIIQTSSPASLEARDGVGRRRLHRVGDGR